MAIVFIEIVLSAGQTYVYQTFEMRHARYVDMSILKQKHPQILSILAFSMLAESLEFMR